ncbi:MAG: Ketopantoate reductase [Microbacteriaceae bacterium]|nr:Ketopantoate reductase [Microbacteriaceae bacterium]
MVIRNYLFRLAIQKSVMKVLVYGAGVLGSLYAARLFEAGHSVSIVARGGRLAALREHGIQLAEVGSATTRRVPVPAAERPVGRYDLILVFVRSHQLAAVLETLAGIEGDVLFLLNWAGGPQPLVDAIGRERVLLGFANQGGTMEGEVVRYRRPSALTRLVAMPIGELDGRETPRLDGILRMFRAAGFAANAQPRMDAWLRTHAAFEVPLGLAVHTAGGPEALAGDPDAVRHMLREMRHNLSALQTRPVPRAFGALRTLPEAVLVPVLRRFLRSAAAAPLTAATPAVIGELELLAEQLRAAEASAAPRR